MRIAKGEEGSFQKLCNEVEKLISMKEPVAFDEVKQSFNKLYETSAEEKHLKSITSNSIHLSHISALDNYVKYCITQESNLKPIQIEKLQLPKFDGNIRNYLMFRKDFVDLVLPLQAAFTCLPKDIETYLSFPSDEVDDMIKCLEKKFCDSGKLLETIISEICDEVSTSLIKFIDIVESGYNDLRNVEIKSELCNANIISMLESKLPRNIGLAWYRRLLYRKGKNSKNRQVLEITGIFKGRKRCIGI